MDSKKTPPNLAQRCWRYMRILLLALGCFLFSSQEAHATHFAGADITYTCVGPNQYLVTLTLYRDCDGVSMSATEFININSASCGLTNLPAIQVPRDTFYEVSQLCPSVIGQSSCNGGNLPGIEVHVYSTIVTFPQACTDWVVSWSSCCRNNAITTLTNQGTMYVEAGINSTLCNSSPTFTSNPTPYFCAGQCYQYNHGALDPDNDTLRYELTCPLQGAGNCIPNVPGLSPTQPLFTNPANSFGFNGNTGQMTFCTQPGLAQFAVAAVTVYQVANGDTVGYVQRDIQMIVINSVNCTSPVNSNNPFVYTGGSFDTTANTFVVCAGDTLVFDLILSDPDGDTIALDAANTNLDFVFGPGNWSTFFNTSPPFSPDSVQVLVQVFTNPTNLGVNQFTIGITDNACPVPGDQILGYNLIIPGVEVSASDTVICPGIQQQLQMTANSFSSVGALAAGTFSWSQVSGPPITFDSDTFRNPIVTVPASTVSGDTIVLSVTFITAPDPVTGTQCTTTDEVLIAIQALPLSLNVFASDTSLCPNMQDDTINLSTAIAGPGIDLVNGIYTWTATPASYLSDLTAANINNPDAILAGGPNDSVTYTVNYTYGLCIGEDSIKLKWRPGIPSLSATQDTICPGDTTQLFGVLTDSIIVNDPTACSTYTVAPITFAPVAGSGTSVSLTDDAVTAALPIGFDFDFYCNTYSQFYISSNGFITFSSGGGSGCCTGQNLPTGGTPNNLIALAWEDLNPNNGGTIEYFTVGTAPNRQLIVNYINVPRFGGANNVTGQIILHEGTNFIDIHSTSIQSNGDNTTQGIENIDGTIGVAVPGRNSSPTWSATNDAYRFSPGVAVLFGPFTFNWSPGFAVSDPSVYNPNAFPQGTTMFHLTLNEQGCVMQDSIEIFVNSQIPVPTVTCGTPANQATSVLFEWGQSPGAAGWEYSLDSGITWVPVPLADSSLLVTGLTNGDCANILVRATGGAGPCPTNAASYLECCTTPCPMPNTSTITNLTCNGSGNGAISIAISGGVLGDHPDFTATLFDTSGNQIGTPISDPATTNFTGLAAGVYYAYITDTLGCFTYSDTVVVTEPNVLVASVDTTALTTCYSSTDGSATVSGAGGTTPYTWQWDVLAGSQTTPTAINLGVGAYPVVLTDSNNCTDTLIVNVNAPFPAPPALSLTSTPSTTCAGNGTGTVFATYNMVGNANNYTYLWSNNDATITANGLPAGTAMVTVTDMNGCTATGSVNITGSPTVSVTSMPSINPGCNMNDGQITAVATGDSAGYTYQWSPNALGQTTALATGLGIGNYSVTVTGLSNGCIAVGTVTLQNNSALNIVGFNIVNPSCGGADGEITVLTTGSGNVAGPITYEWAPGGQTTNPATGLSAGTYTVTVTDQATGCASVGDTTLTQPQLSASFINISNPACNLSTGSITAIASGAPGPFTYLWSDPLAQTTATAQGLAAGSYTCTVTYQGCSIVIPATTLTNDSLQISVADMNGIICNGDTASAYINLDVLPATANPTFMWSNNATTQNISGLSAGIYTVTASLGNACQTTLSATIADITLTLNATINNDTIETIQLNDSIAIDAGVTTNHSNPSYMWTADSAGVVSFLDSSMASTFAKGIGGGHSWLYITANAGPCSAVDSVFITVESYLGMPTAFTPNGDGINDFFRPAGLQNSDKVLQFKVYNRWGQLLYDDIINHEWDGTYQGVPQPQDVYIYTYEYAPANRERIIIRGEFTLIR